MYGGVDSERLFQSESHDSSTVGTEEVMGHGDPYSDYLPNVNDS